MFSFKFFLSSLIFISVFLLILFYQYSNQYFTPTDKSHREVTGSYRIYFSKPRTNSITRSSKSFSPRNDSQTATTLNIDSKYATRYSITKSKIVNELKNTKRTDFDGHGWVHKLNYTIDYGDKTCKETKNGNPNRKSFVRLLKRWNQISKRYNIPYFLVYGSLIGALRNADFVPWDGDMDILVDETYYETLSKIDNNRNFTPSADDPNFHLVVQNYFRSDYSNMHKTRENCLGKVSSNITIGILNIITFK